MAVGTAHATNDRGSHIDASLRRHTFRRIRYCRTTGVAVVGRGVRRRVFIGALSLQRLRENLRRHIRRVRTNLVNNRPNTLSFRTTRTACISTAVQTATP